MNILNQIYYTVKRIFMESKAVVVKLLSFIVLILILGSAFSNAFEVSSLDKVTILCYNGDKGESGKSFIDSLMEVDSIKDIVDFKEVTDFKEAEKMIDKEEAEALVCIPEQFSEQVVNEEEKNIIEVYRRKYSGISSTVVENVVESYVNGLNCASVVFKMQGNLEGFNFTAESGLEEQPLTASGKVPTSMGYYALSMLLMMMLYGAEYGCSGTAEESIGVLGDRIKLSPMKTYQQYIGKIAGLSLVTFIQAIIIILFTKVVYDVDWGSNIPLLLAIIFSFSVVTTTMGAMLCIFTRDESKAQSIITVLVIVFTFLAGGFVYADFTGIEQISLSYYAKSAILNMVYAGDLSVVYRNIGIMWAVTVVFIIISVIIAERKKA